ncbi:cytochrome b/b6 domain-containing protein [Mesoterricola sediminis]|uniref:Cytochrome c n=1 Tax=Mesoterricola sediminis TaxID=2927980 RepID=A0AA48GWP2_9BACT|nr:cytochrome b/b6 domain-containing protein [Mesoterricola sediminis]BDU75795.1 cytochrome c [Mesoterricola sediminis]
MNLGIVRSALLVMVSSLAFAAQPAGPDDACFACHGRKPAAHAKGPQAPFVDKGKFEASIHGGNGCTSCHADVDLGTHPGKKSSPVACASCHEKPAKTYEASAHGKARKAGNTGAASCAECHGTHDIMKATAVGSPVRRENLHTTCGMCHPEVVKDIEASVHGKATAAGVLEAPVCTDCHSDHALESLKSASPIKVSQQVCSRCHGSSRMNAKFDLPDDRVTTFFESYHGMAAKMGSPNAANCASCHGYHLVLPASDERSTINKANLVATCGKCHPNANEKFSFGKIHQDKKAVADLSSKVDHWVRAIYMSIIFGTIGFMAVHNFLLLRRKAMASLRDPNRTVVRMNVAARIQHLMLASSFIFLVVSGFALKYPNSWLGWCMGSSEVVRRIGHRVAAVVMITGGFIHLFYIFTRDGRKFVKDMLPELKDATDILAQFKYLLVPGSPKPQFKRFGYPEKMEYWAVVWGTILMGATGGLIWFKMYFTRWMPRWIVDVSITVHYYEAILATLAIIVWHFYFVFLDPEVYPVNWAFLDGKITPHHQHEEHPLEPMEGLPTHGDPDEK